MAAFLETEATLRLFSARLQPDHKNVTAFSGCNQEHPAARLRRGFPDECGFPFTGGPICRKLRHWCLGLSVLLSGKAPEIDHVG
jgi:hypothetical protein